MWLRPYLETKRSKLRSLVGGQGYIYVFTARKWSVRMAPTTIVQVAGLSIV